MTAGGSAPDVSREYFGRDLEAMSFAVNYHNWIIDEFRSYLGTRVAEVGAGTGNFTELLIAAGAGVQSLVAFEPSPNMYPLLARRMAGIERVRTVHSVLDAGAASAAAGGGPAPAGSDGGRAKAGSTGVVRAETGAAPFDSVLYVNVLEHIADDAGELRRARDALRPGGHVLIFVPALRWLFSDLDRALGHQRRYHKRGLERLVRDAGFRIIRAQYFDVGGILPWYVAFVLFKRTLTRGSVSAYDRVVVPVMQRLERVVAPPIGKNLLVVGERIQAGHVDSCRCGRDGSRATFTGTFTGMRSRVLPTRVECYGG